MGYECIMCMEELEAPAPASVVAIPHDPTYNETNEANPGRKRPVKRQHTKEDLTEICSTVCGHMFHRACLNRWFHQKMKKECPSCRKLLSPGKIFALYPPGSSEDFNANNNNNNKLQLTEFEERSLPHVHCASEGCTQLYEIHKTLVSDYNKLLEKYTENSDALLLTNAQVRSLEDECLRLKNINRNVESFIKTPRKCPSCFKDIDVDVRVTNGKVKQVLCQCNRSMKPGFSKDLTDANSSPTSTQVQKFLQQKFLQRQRVSVVFNKGNDSAAFAALQSFTAPTLKSIDLNSSSFQPVLTSNSNPCFNFAQLASTTLNLPVVSSSNPPTSVSTSSATDKYTGRIIAIAKRELLKCPTCQTMSFNQGCRVCFAKKRCFSEEGTNPQPSASTSSTLVAATATAAESLTPPLIDGGRAMWVCPNCIVPNSPDESACLFCAGENPNLIKDSTLNAATLTTLTSLPVPTFELGMSTAPAAVPVAGPSFRAMWVCPNCIVPNSPDESACVFCAGKNPNLIKDSTLNTATVTSLPVPTFELGMSTAPAAVPVAGPSFVSLAQPQNSGEPNWFQAIPKTYNEVCQVVPAVLECIQSAAPFSAQSQPQKQFQGHQVQHDNLNQNVMIPLANDNALTQPQLSNAILQQESEQNCLPFVNPGSSP